MQLFLLLRRWQGASCRALQHCATAGVSGCHSREFANSVSVTHAWLWVVWMKACAAGGRWLLVSGPPFAEAITGNAESGVHLMGTA